MRPDTVINMRIKVCSALHEKFIRSGLDEALKPTEFPDRYNSPTKNKQKNQQKMLMSG
jgi:hypothetical protein